MNAIEKYSLKSKNINKHFKLHNGQSLLEYVLILAGFAIVLTFIIGQFGTSLGNLYQSIIDGYN